MTALTIELTDDQFQELALRAEESGVEPQVQLQTEVGALFDVRRERLRTMIREVVRDNQALYERLA